MWMIKSRNSRTVRALAPRNRARDPPISPMKRNKIEVINVVYFCEINTSMCIKRRAGDEVGGSIWCRKEWVVDSGRVKVVMRGRYKPVHL